MSRGTKITPLRLSPELLSRIHAAIDSNNMRRSEEPYDLTGWIRQAIEERLAKLERGRKSAQRKKEQRGEGQQPGDQAGDG